MESENKKPSNPNAFPNDYNFDDGMTLRDYFANSAMQGILSNNLPHFGQPEFYAEVVYQIADAMLKQREL